MSIYAMTDPKKFIVVELESAIVAIKRAIQAEESKPTVAPPNSENNLLACALDLYDNYRAGKATREMYNAVWTAAISYGEARRREEKENQ